jgi:hypothetical protein
VDALEADDLESAQALSPAQKLAQALEMMSAAIPTSARAQSEATSHPGE